MSPRPGASFSKGETVAARMLRAGRYERRISQRELADLACVQRTAVSRIEAGRVTPGVGTFCALLGAMGYRLGLVDHRDRPLVLDPERDALLELRDRADRHLPAHLRPVRFDSRGNRYWWGWHRIAWPFSDDWVPSHVYFARTQRDVVSLAEGWAPRVWDDAT